MPKKVNKIEFTWYKSDGSNHDKNDRLHFGFEKLKFLTFQMKKSLEFSNEMSTRTEDYKSGYGLL